jgi:hypothetical protein
LKDRTINQCHALPATLSGCFGFVVFEVDFGAKNEETITVFVVGRSGS